MFASADLVQTVSGIEIERVKRLLLPALFLIGELLGPGLSPSGLFEQGSILLVRLGDVFLKVSKMIALEFLKWAVDDDEAALDPGTPPHGMPREAALLVEDIVPNVLAGLPIAGGTRRKELSRHQGCACGSCPHRVCADQ